MMTADMAGTLTAVLRKYWERVLGEDGKQGDGPERRQADDVRRAAAGGGSLCGERGLGKPGRMW